MATPGGRVPLPGTHGFKDASVDPEQIRAWWAERPDANIGIRTGKGSAVVVDVDRHGKGDGEESLAALEAEYQVKAAEARYTDLKVQLESARLSQETNLARIESDYRQAKLRADRDVKRADAGLMIELDRQISVAAAEQFQWSSVGRGGAA